MRREVLVQLILAAAFLIAWLFVPIYEVAGPAFTIRLEPWGFAVDLLGIHYVVVPPTVFAISLFALASSLMPVVWRQTRYPLYLAALMAVLSLTMAVTTILFQWRYMVVRGYITAPTPTGYIYIQLPHAVSLGPPAYMLAVLVAIAVMNAVTGAKWLRYREWSLADAYAAKGALGAIEEALKRLNIPYTKAGNELRVGDLTIREADGEVVIAKAGAVMAVNGGYRGAPEEAVALAISYAVEYALEGGSKQADYEGE